jgi:hypothetical protein
VTVVARLVAVLAIALVVAAPAAGSRPHYVYYDVAFVTLIGKGSVTTTPHAMHCPGVCRVRFVRGTHVVLHAVAAKGWRFTGFSSKWCGERTPRCGFDLVSTHDCSGGPCPLGSFGVRVNFVRLQNGERSP